MEIYYVHTYITTYDVSVYVFSMMCSVEVHRYVMIVKSQILMIKIIDEVMI